MSTSLVHRGPDAEFMEIADSVGFAVRRLAVIDVAAGRQPLYNEDRTVRVIFNGEIYNFRELRSELESAGHVLSSSTDGEVLPHLWEEYGPQFTQRLNGMFAIALHDLRQKRLLMVRDRFGIKPLFIYRDSRSLLFASEIKALLASGRVTPELDLTALATFLAWEYVPGPRTLFKRITKLAPGSRLELDLESGESSVETWWDLAQETMRAGLDRPAPDADPREWEELVDYKIRQSVQSQLVSDVPLGSFLSGGVDSSLIAHAMGQPRAFTIGFSNPTYDETPWAELVARHLEVSHRVERLSPDALDLFDRLMQFMDDPIGDFSIFPTYLVSQLARDEVTVALTGDGGDELFGGYDTYVAQNLSRLWARIPEQFHSSLTYPLLARIRPRQAKKGWVNKAKRFAEGMQYPSHFGHARWRLFSDSAFLDQLIEPEIQQAIEQPIGDHIGRLRESADTLSPLKQSLYVDVYSYLVDNCLVKVDRMAMACSLEARVPMLDHELATIAFSLPDPLLVTGTQTKVLLKRVAARYLPRQCIYRPKEGFSIPLKDWLNRELGPLVDDLLDPAKLAAQGIFRPEIVDRLCREHRSGAANHSHRLWTLMVFEDWARRWKVL